jgi:hypothetical protein
MSFWELPFDTTPEILLHVFEERYCRREPRGADLEVSWSATKLVTIHLVDCWASPSINFQCCLAANFSQSIDGLWYTLFVPGSTRVSEIPHCSFGILPATIKFFNPCPRQILVPAHGQYGPLAIQMHPEDCRGRYGSCSGWQTCPNLDS